LAKTEAKLGKSSDGKSGSGSSNESSSDDSSYDSDEGSGENSESEKSGGEEATAPENQNGVSEVTKAKSDPSIIIERLAKQMEHVNM